MKTGIGDSFEMRIFYYSYVIIVKICDSILRKYNFIGK